MKFISYWDARLSLIKKLKPLLYNPLIIYTLFFSSGCQRSYHESSLTKVPSRPDGHCILHSIITSLKYANKPSDQVEETPKISDLLSHLESEVLNNLDHYGSFINSEDVDCIQELENYKQLKSYNNDTNDLVLAAMSNYLNRKIIILKKSGSSYKLEHSESCIIPRHTRKDFKSPILLEKVGPHYDALIEKSSKVF